METTEKRISKNKAVILFIICFYTIWYLFEFFGKPVISEHFPSEVNAQIVKTFIKILVWVLPEALLVHYYKDEVCIGLKEMFTAKVKWLYYLPVFLIFVLYPIISAYLRNGSLTLRSDFGMVKIISYTFVGITEEMVFRGWLLNSMTDKDKKYPWGAILLNSLFFVAIHIPTWTTHGELTDNILHFKFIGIIVLSFIFSFTFLKSRNILIPVVLHMIWDFLLSMF